MVWKTMIGYKVWWIKIHGCYGGQILFYFGHDILYCYVKV